MFDQGKLLQNRLIDSWTEEEVHKLHGDIVISFMDSNDEHGVFAAVEYAKYLKHRGLDNLNYTLFLDLLLHENEEVIVALLGDGIVFKQFNKLQRTNYLVNACFELLKRFTPGKVFEMTLKTLLNVFKQHYRNASVGYKLYALSIDEINYIGKYLETRKTQGDKINRIILDILSDLGELNSKDTKDHRIDRIGAHANKIRSAFLDKKATLEEAIPASIMARET
jgi:hypothetical protein